HRPLHFRAGGRRDLAFRQHPPLPARRAELFDALPHDSDGLAHLFHADDLAIIIVAMAPDRNVEIHFLIAFVRLSLTQVPRRAGAAHHDAGKSPAPAILQTDDADVDVALLEDAVVDEQLRQIITGFEEGVAPGFNVVDQPRRNVHVDAAGAEIIRMQARAGSPL